VQVVGPGGQAEHGPADRPLGRPRVGARADDPRPPRRARFSAASLHRILSSVTAGDVERNQSALVETLSAVAARAQDGRELAGSLMGAIGWELADRRDNPVREQLAVLVLGGSGEGGDYTTQP
jgi:hypothetical protein